MEIFEKAIHDMTVVQQWEIRPEQFNKHLHDVACQVAAVQDRTVRDAQVAQQLLPTEAPLPQVRLPITKVPLLNSECHSIQIAPNALADAQDANVSSTPVATLIRAYEMNRALPGTDPHPPMSEAIVHADPAFDNQSSAGPSHADPHLPMYARDFHADPAGDSRSTAGPAPTPGAIVVPELDVPQPFPEAIAHDSIVTPLPEGDVDSSKSVGLPKTTLTAAEPDATEVSPEADAHLEVPSDIPAFPGQPDSFADVEAAKTIVESSATTEDDRGPNSFNPHLPMSCQVFHAEPTMGPSQPPAEPVVP